MYSRGPYTTVTQPGGVYNPATGRVEKTNYNPYNQYNARTGSWGGVAGQAPLVQGGAMPRYNANVGMVTGSNSVPQSGGNSSGQARIEESRRQIMDMTRGRAEELKTDPYIAEALEYLKEVMSGQRQPYDDKTKAAYLSESSDQAAAAETAQQDMLRQQYLGSGGSTSDPAYQAAVRRLMGERQGQNQVARREIDKNATLSNFQASMSAAPALLSGRQSQNALINDVLGRAVDFLSADAYSQNIGEGLRASGSTGSTGTRDLGNMQGSSRISGSSMPYGNLLGGGANNQESPNPIYGRPPTRVSGSQLGMGSLVGPVDNRDLIADDYWSALMNDERLL